MSGNTSVGDGYEPPADLKERMAKSYDRLAPTYNSWTYSHLSPRLVWLQKLLDGISSSFADNDARPYSILELGAGAGLPTTKAILESAEDVHVYANDLSPAQLKLLERNLGQLQDRITLKPGDMLALDFEPNSLAAVVGMYSIIHLPISEQEALLQKIGKWLRPGGMLLANFGTEESKGLTVERWLGVDSAWVYWASLGVKGTLKAISAAKLEVLEHEKVSGGNVDADFVWILAQKPVTA